jgi:hypothetical protein
MALQRFKDWHQEGSAYVRWSLSSSFSLAVAVERKWAIERGTMEAFTPAGQEVENFKWGAGSPVSECREAIVTVCHEFLSEPGRVVVFEHHLVRPSDPHGYLQTPVRISEDAVYQVAFPSMDRALLEKQVHDWNNVPISNAFLAEIGAEPAAALERSVDDSMLELEPIVTALRGVILGAYDGEGFVVWRPS